MMHTDRSGAKCKGKEILSSSSAGNTLHPFHSQANLHPRWLLGVWPGFCLSHLTTRKTAVRSMVSGRGTVPSVGI